MQLTEKLVAIADTIREKTGSTEKLTLDQMASEVGKLEEEAQTYILQDEDGNEVTAVFVENETVFDATADDIRLGKTAATGDGVVVGTKVIPSYHTTEGYRVITAGSPFETLSMADLDLYDFTKLQAVICPVNGSIDNSVAAEKIAINENVYAVQSTEAIATVIKDSETKRINLGITNESGSPYLLRYFTYKEIV